MTDIEEIKSRLDIVDIVGQYVPGLKKAGRNYRANCPFHQEKTPSFMVNPDLQIFKCFGCGEGGDVISFIQKIERLEFGETLQTAAETANYELKNRGGGDTGKLKEDKQQLLDANSLASEYWHYILMTHSAGKLGREYMTKRGIRKEEAELFKLGFAPKGNNLTAFLRKKGFKDNDLVRWGLSVERKGSITDKFRERLMLPILNMKGQPIGFSGRIIVASDFAPKYLNSSETLVYKKNEILMGLYQGKDAARQKNCLILEEGNIDLLSSHKVGIANIAATGGTAITELQCKLLKRYADEVYFAFDTDQAGLKALIRGIELAEKVSLAHKVLDLGQHQDPDAMIAEDPKLWETAVAKPINSIEYLMKLYAKQFDLGTADGKSEYAKHICSILKLLRDDVQREHFAGELAMKVGVGKDTILKQVRDTKAAPVPISLKEETPSSSQAPSANTISAGKRELYFLALLTELENVAELHIEPGIFFDTSCQEIFKMLEKYPSNERNYSKISDEISPEAKELLQDILMVDLESIQSELEEEIVRIHDLLYTAYLRRKILDLRAGLNEEPENTAVLRKLQLLTSELQELSST